MTSVRYDMTARLFRKFYLSGLLFSKWSSIWSLYFGNFSFARCIIILFWLLF